MRIAIDGSAIPRQMAGAGVYTYQLVRALGRLNTEHQLAVFARRGLFDDLADDFEVIEIMQKGRAARLVWEQCALPFLLRRHGVDLLHSPHHHTPIIPGIRRVVTINDVTFLILPDRYPPVRRVYMASVTRAAARIANAIIVPSEAVRNDVQERLGPRAPLHVIPDAHGPTYAPAADAEVIRVRAAYSVPGSYVLSVGSLEPGKNRTRLIRAFAALNDGHRDVQLIIVGQRAWDYDGDFELVQSLGLANRIRFLGYVPDGDMPALYTGAVVSAFPSLYEGFGIPVLESMACGTPVITSNVGSTKEVAGEAALLVDPLDADELAIALKQMLGDEELRADLAERGLERAKQFSWERTARETLAVYEEVLGR